ncbi:hypothetical protein [Rhizobium leguminosarum]|nr:hypothetical protein [Rhizobium leguminosarum]
MDNNSIMLSRRNIFRAGAGLGLALAATTVELAVAPTSRRLPSTTSPR